MKSILPHRLAIATLALSFLTSVESNARVFGVGVGVRRVGVGAVGVGGVAAEGVASAYYHSLPAGYRAVAYGGYNCYYAGGVYYRPIIYGGDTVYVVVQ